MSRPRHPFRAALLLTALALTTGCSPGTALPAGVSVAGRAALAPEAGSLRDPDRYTAFEELAVVSGVEAVAQGAVVGGRPPDAFVVTAQGRRGDRFTVLLRSPGGGAAFTLHGPGDQLLERGVRAASVPLPGPGSYLVVVTAARASAGYELHAGVARGAA